MKKIVVSGAPSSGKSSFLRSVEASSYPNVIVLSETAMVLLQGGHPPPAAGALEQIRNFQQLILNLQRKREAEIAKQNPDAKFCVLDRGTLDGVGYWSDNFFETFNVELNDELSIYHSVFFFEIPSERFFGGTDEIRFHNYEQSFEIGRKQRETWSKHSNFVSIAAAPTLTEKLAFAHGVLQTIIS